MTGAGPRIGELFAGYGGLGMGVQAALGGEIAWFSEFDKGPSKILAHRFPGIPNHGDITKIDWSQVEPIDVLTGGSPCQDLSHAGKRQGMTDGTRSNLWVAMREAVAQLRPSLVIWENVRGAYSAEAASSLVDDPRLLAGTRRRDGEPVLRALGRVLGDLSDLGYDASWHGLRAADVGAPHGRFRVFVIATDAQRGGRDGWTSVARRGQVERTTPQGTSEGTLLPTPRTSDRTGAGVHGEGGLDLSTAVTLLPTPACNDMGEGKTVEAWDEWTAKMKAAHGNGNGHGASLSIEAQRILPTPRAFGQRTSRHAATTAYRRSAPSLEQAVEIAEGVVPREIADGAEVQDSWRATWAQYADAIHRWENLTRPVPPPTEIGPKGNPRLSAAFSEWMMGLPVGWVTDVPGITRNEALKALGNGVVPQQCAAALREMFAWEVAA